MTGVPRVSVSRIENIRGADHMGWNAPHANGDVKMRMDARESIQRHRLAILLRGVRVLSRLLGRFLTAASVTAVPCRAGYHEVLLAGNTAAVRNRPRSL